MKYNGLFFIFVIGLLLLTGCASKKTDLNAPVEELQQKTLTVPNTDGETASDTQISVTPEIAQADIDEATDELITQEDLNLGELIE